MVRKSMIDPHPPQAKTWTRAMVWEYPESPNGLHPEHYAHSFPNNDPVKTPITMQEGPEFLRKTHSSFHTINPMSSTDAQFAHLVQAPNAAFCSLFGQHAAAAMFGSHCMPPHGHYHGIAANQRYNGASHPYAPAPTDMPAGVQPRMGGQQQASQPAPQASQPAPQASEPHQQPCGGGAPSAQPEAEPAASGGDVEEMDADGEVDLDEEEAVLKAAMAQRAAAMKRPASADDDRPPVGKLKPMKTKKPPNTAMKAAPAAKKDAPAAKGAMKSRKTSGASTDFFDSEPKPKKTPPPPTGTTPHKKYRGVCNIYTQTGLIRGVIGRKFDKRVRFGAGTDKTKQDAWMELVTYLDTKLQ